MATRLKRSFPHALVVLFLLGVVATIWWVLVLGDSGATAASAAGPDADPHRGTLAQLPVLDRGTDVDAASGKSARTRVALVEPGADDDLSGAPDPDDEIIRIVGRVEDPLGRPLPGIQAQLRWVYPSEQELSLLDHEDHVTVTDDLGAFELRPHGWSLLRLTLTSDRHQSYYRTLGWAPQNVDLGVIVLMEASQLSGRVVDDAGLGVEGSRVRCFDAIAAATNASVGGGDRDASALTGKDGRFTTKGPIPRSGGTRWLLVAEHPDFIAGTAQGELKLGEVRDVVIRLSTGATLRGRVDGLTAAFWADHPQLSISVATQARSRQEDDTTVDYGDRRVPIGADGTFTISGLRPAEALALSVWTQDRECRQSRRRSPFVLVSIPPLPAAAELLIDDVAIPVKTPPRLRIEVTDPEGGPIPGLVARSSWGEVVLPDRQRVMGDCSMPAGTVDVLIESLKLDASDPIDARLDAPDFKRWSSGEIKVEAEETHSFGRIILQRGEDATALFPVDPELREVSVRVVDAKGVALPRGGCGYRVQEEGARLSWSRSDRSGVVQLSLKRDTAYELRYFNIDREFGHGNAWLGDLCVTWVQLPPGDESGPLTVAAPAFARLDATLTLDGAALPGASLSLEAVRSGARDTRGEKAMRLSGGALRADALGRVVVEGLYPGNWRAWTFHSDLNMGQSFELRLEAGMNKISLDRSMTGLQGRVVDTDGMGVEGIVVRVVLAGDTMYWAFSRASNHRYMRAVGEVDRMLAARDNTATVTDVDGCYSLAGLTVGIPVAASIATPGFVVDATGPFTPVAGGMVEVEDLKLVPAGSLRVVLPTEAQVDLDLDPVVNADGTQDSDASFSLSTAELSSRTIECIPPGRWTLSQYWHDQEDDDGMIEAVELVVEIRAGEETVVDFARTGR